MLNTNSDTTSIPDPIPTISFLLRQISQTEPASMDHNQQWSVFLFSVVDSNTVLISIAHGDHEIEFLDVGPFFGLWTPGCHLPQAFDCCFFRDELPVWTWEFGEQLLEFWVDGRE